MEKARDAYVSIDSLYKKYGNKFEGVGKLIDEAKQGVELTGDAPNQAIYKAIERVFYSIEKPKEIVEESIKELEKEPEQEPEGESKKGTKESSKK